MPSDEDLELARDLGIVIVAGYALKKLIWDFLFKEGDTDEGVRRKDNVMRIFVDIKKKLKKIAEKLNIPISDADENERHPDSILLDTLSKRLSIPQEKIEQIKTQIHWIRKIRNHIAHEKYTPSESEFKVVVEYHHNFENFCVKYNL